jgi:ADP-heptose:LPS heptosyltransferase
MQHFRRSIRIYEEQAFLRQHPEHGEILVGRSQGLGDILMLTPSIRALSSSGWKVVLGVCKHFVPAVANNPDVYSIVACEPNEMPDYKCHNKLDLNWKVERMRGKQFTTPRAKLFAELCHVEPTSWHPTLVVDDDDRKEAMKLTKGKDYIVIPAEASSHYRSYKRTPELVAELLKRGHRVALTHHFKRYSLPKHKNFLDLQKKVDVGVLCALIERARAVISPDTGPMHVGLTLRVPTVCLEGPMPPDIYTSHYEGSPKRILQRPFKCLGCGHRGQFHGAHCGEYKRQPQECMDFAPEEVADAVETLVKEKAAA